MQYKIEFFDFWSTASGLSGGAFADSLCLKDENGLPFIPGKTIKGLLREAAETIQSLQVNLLSENFINEVFGTHESKPNRQESKTFFSNLFLDKETATAIKDKKGLLYEYITSTAINKDGVADDHSLRRIEYVLPCTLYGSVRNIDNVHKRSLENCVHFIKRMGLNRTRGYGRCKISII